jgi:hypothetical protein
MFLTGKFLFMKETIKMMVAWGSVETKSKMLEVLVDHSCNPCYLGGRDQEDCSSNQPRQSVCETLSQKTHHKKGLVG